MRFVKLNQFVLRSSFFLCWFASLSLVNAAPIRCTQNSHGQGIEIIENGEAIELQDIEFRSPAFVSQALACEKWMAEEGGLQLIQELGGKLELNKNRLGGEAAGTFYRACSQSSSCRVRFPYFLFHIQDSLAVFVNQFIRREKVIAKDLCSEPQTSPSRSALAVNWESESIDNFQTWLTPISSFVAEVEKLLLASAPRYAFVSTMSLSDAALERLSRVLQTLTETDLFILYDVNTRLLNENTWPSLHQRLHLIPVYPQPASTGNFHIKLFATSLGDFIFTSSNLSNPESQSIIDLGVSGRSPALANEMGGVLEELARVSCENTPYFLCSLDARFERDQSTYFEFTKQLSSSCQKLRASSEYFPKFSDGFLRLSHAQSLDQDIEDLIGSAKKTLLVHSFELSSQKVIRALDIAVKRGVDLKIVIGDHELAGENNSALLRDRQISRSYSGGLQPHSKFIIADSQKALWCSGNFTRSGLVISKEICWPTMNPKIIESLVRYFENSAHFLGVDLEARPPLELDSYVYIPYSLQQKDTIQTAISNGELRVSEIAGDLFRIGDRTKKCLAKLGSHWLYHPESLKSCGF